METQFKKTNCDIKNIKCRELRNTIVELLYAFWVVISLEYMLFYLYYLCIEVQLIYNITLVTGVHKIIQYFMYCKMIIIM